MIASLISSPSAFQLITFVSESSDIPWYLNPASPVKFMANEDTESASSLKASPRPMDLEAERLNWIAFVIFGSLGDTSSRSTTPSPSESKTFPGSSGNGSVTSGSPSLSSSVSWLLPKPSPSVSSDSLPSKGNASTSSKTPSLSSSGSVWSGEPSPSKSYNGSTRMFWSTEKTPSVTLTIASKTISVP